MQLKYKIGDHVMYGMSGACEVAEIGTLDFAGPDKIYYTLKPVYDARDTIYLLVEKEGEIIRKVIGKKRAKEVLERIREQTGTEVAPNRESWEEILKTSEHEGIVSMILQLREIRRENKKNHKGLNIADAKLLTYAERILYSEMAIALGISMDDAFHQLDELLG